MLDELQLFFVWAPVINIQLILRGNICGRHIRVKCLWTCLGLGRDEYQKSRARRFLLSQVAIWPSG